MTGRRAALIVGAALAAVLLALGARWCQTQPRGDEIARVGGYPITRSEQQQMSGYLRAIADERGSSMGKDERARASLIQLYQYQIVREMAAVHGIDVDAQVVERDLRDLRESCCSGVSSRWRQHLKQLGISQQLLVRDLEHQNLVKQLSEKLRAEADVDISDVQVKEAYAAQGGDLPHPRYRRVMMILINELPYDGLDEQDRTLTGELYQRLRQGEDAQGLADEYSNLAGSDTSGHMRIIPDDKNEWPQPLLDAVFKTKTGQLAAPLCLTKPGYVGCYIVIASEPVTPAGKTRLADVEDELRKQLEEDAINIAPIVAIRKRLLEDLDLIVYSDSYTGPRLRARDIRKLFDEGLIPDA